MVLKIVSGKELIEMELPERDQLWGEFLKSKDKMAIIAREKMCKSFLALLLGVAISNAYECLGYMTEKCNVLYINFEITIEKLKERLEDILAETKLTLSNIYTITFPGGLPLDTPEGKNELSQILDECRSEGIEISVVIIDPRRQSMKGDENQSETLNTWCQNIDKLQDEYGFALIVVHHVGKSTTGAGRGSSVFDGWLTTILTITPSEFTIKGRDFESTEIPAKFEFPLWKISQEELEKRKSAVDKAKKTILDYLTAEKEVLQVNLRRYMLKQQFSEYAFKEAIRVLQEEGRIKITKAEGVRGHHKKICITDSS